MAPELQNWGMQLTPVRPAIYLNIQAFSPSGFYHKIRPKVLLIQCVIAD